MRRLCLLAPFLLPTVPAFPLEPQHTPEVAEAFAQGHYYAATKDCERAVTHWETVLRAEPEHWQTHVAMAECRLRMKQPDQAMEHLVSAQKTNPSATVSALLEKARTTRRGQPQSSERVLWVLSPLEADLQRMVSESASLGSGSFSTPNTQTKVDPKSGSIYQITRRLDGSTEMTGENPTTGSTWRTLYKPDGSMTGVNAEGNAWMYDSRTTLYMNENGVTCVGEGDRQTCAKR